MEVINKNKFGFSPIVGVQVGVNKEAFMQNKVVIIYVQNQMFMVCYQDSEAMIKVKKIHQYHLMKHKLIN